MKEYQRSLNRIAEVLRKAGMAEEKKEFQTDAVQGVKTVGGTPIPTTGEGVKIVGGGKRPSEVTTLDKHPQK